MGYPGRISIGFPVFAVGSSLRLIFLSLVKSPTSFEIAIDASSIILVHLPVHHESIVLKSSIDYIKTHWRSCFYEYSYQYSGAVLFSSYG